MEYEQANAMFDLRDAYGFADRNYAHLQTLVLALYVWLAMFAMFLTLNRVKESVNARVKSLETTVDALSRRVKYLEKEADSY